MTSPASTEKKTQIHAKIGDVWQTVNPNLTKKVDRRVKKDNTNEL